MEYSVEISPEVEAPIKSILYFQDSSWVQAEQMELLGNSFTAEKALNHFEQPRKYLLSFDGLEPEQVYKLTFSTELNGTTIMQTIRNFQVLDV